ncbi:MAG: TetR family transcriptional regulator, partial [Deltaproteobacteria bacterium]|nr:TetR family transcriptional regulator [Deltaproteobacteria bacterium]
LQRKLVAQAACDVIARGGMEGASVRAIARELDCTIGMLPRYFKNKEDLLLTALRTAAERSLRGAGRTLERSENASMLGYLLAALPTTPEKSLYWRVLIAYLGAAIGNPKLAQAYREIDEGYRGWLLADLRQRQASGKIAPGVDLEQAADALDVFTDGLGLHAVLEPERYPPERLEAMLADYLEKVLGAQA